MGMSLSEAKAKVKQVTVEYEDWQVDVGYRPGAVTPALLEEVQTAAQAGETRVIGVMLAPIVDWWDVLDDEGNRIPATEDNISQVPLGFVMALLTQVQGAMRPPESKR